jgi:sigma-B regulation protein RsbU (phosphoserine phosphatase)
MSNSPTYPTPSTPGSRAPAERLALLYDLSQAFNSSLDLDEILNRVMDEVIIATRAERGFVMLRDDNGELIFHAARAIDQKTVEDPAFQVSLSIVKSVAQNGQAVISDDAQIDPRWDMRQSVRILGLRSILCVPLQVKGRVLGIIYVDNRIRAGIFTQADLELMIAIGISAATAIENARLYQVAVEKGRLEKELQMARQVQLDLLPRAIPQIQGWEFAALWLPARQVAGDFYDFIPAEDGKLGIAIGDVSDKGMPAALFMALTRSTLRASMDPALLAQEGICRANSLISDDSNSGMFVTLVFAWLDPEAGEITYVNAGHNPPLYFQQGKRPGTGFLARLERTGMALGVQRDFAYCQRTQKFSPGDFVVFYTDGVIDALNGYGQDFGMERLETLVLEQRQNSAQQLVSALEQAVRQFIGDQAFFDDITLVVARRIF